MTESGKWETLLTKHHPFLLPVSVFMGSSLTLDCRVHIDTTGQSRKYFFCGDVAPPYKPGCAEAIFLL